MMIITEELGRVKKSLQANGKNEFLKMRASLVHSHLKNVSHSSEHLGEGQST